MARVEQEILIRNKLGLHARPAALFVQTASKFDSSIHIKKDTEVVDAKSIMNILSLGIETGATVFLIAEGDDAEQAIEELRKILEADE